MAACRVEKGYRHWGHDITDEDTPLEAGLQWTVKMKKSAFIGQEALQVSKNYERTVTARTEMRLMILHGEELRRLSRKYPLLGQRVKQEVPW